MHNQKNRCEEDICVKNAKNSICFTLKTQNHHKKHNTKNLNLGNFLLFIEILVFHILELQITLISFTSRYLRYFPQVGDQCFRINSYNSLIMRKYKHKPSFSCSAVGRILFKFDLPLNSASAI